MKYIRDDIVTRVSHDYTNGRKGQVMKVDRVSKKVRVKWFLTQSGASLKVIRTWVLMTGIK